MLLLDSHLPSRCGQVQSTGIAAGDIRVLVQYICHRLIGPSLDHCGSLCMTLSREKVCSVCDRLAVYIS